MKFVLDVNNWRRELGEDVQAEIKAVSRIKTFNVGEAIYSSLEEPDCCFQLISGEVKVSNYSLSGQEFILSTLSPGECFGEIGMYTNTLRTNNCIAVKKSEVSILKKRDFERLSLRFPEIHFAVTRCQCYRVEMLFNLLEDAYLLPLKPRLCKLLSRLAHSKGMTDEEGNLYLKDISHEMLGQMIGGVRQSVSRELKAMEASGMIKCGYNTITILDLPAVEDEFHNLVSRESLMNNRIAQLK